MEKSTSWLDNPKLLNEPILRSDKIALQLKIGGLLTNNMIQLTKFSFIYRKISN